MADITGTVNEPPEVYNPTKRSLPRRLDAGPTFATSPREVDDWKLREESSGPTQIALASTIRDQITSLQGKLQALEATNNPRTILPELHNAQTGRIDAQKVADFMGIALKPLCAGLRLNYSSVHRNTAAASLQVALRPLKRSLELLQEFLGKSELVRIWLNLPHPDLDGTTALETILAGQTSAVHLLLENAWNGVPV